MRLLDAHSIGLIIHFTLNIPKMRFFAGSASILLVFTCANASPFPDAKGATALAARQDSNGSYTVPGLGVRKQAILGAGGNTLDLAIAMLET